MRGRPSHCGISWGPRVPSGNNPRRGPQADIPVQGRRPVTPLDRCPWNTAWHVTARLEGAFAASTGRRSVCKPRSAPNHGAEPWIVVDVIASRAKRGVSNGGKRKMSVLKNWTIAYAGDNVDNRSETFTAMVCRGVETGPRTPPGPSGSRLHRANYWQASSFRPVTLSTPLPSTTSTDVIGYRTTNPHSPPLRSSCPPDLSVPQLERSKSSPKIVFGCAS